jgi:prophage antirepressor-like protein
MSADLQLFRNGEFELPIIPDGDSFRVYGGIVAEQLRHRKAVEMVRSLDDDEKIIVKADDSNPQVNPGASLRLPPEQGFSGAVAGQGVWYLTEPGFYRAVGQRNVNLIKDPDVKKAVYRFQRWVFHEVVPMMMRAGYAKQMGLHPGTTWTWGDVAAQLRQRYGVDYLPSKITAGLRSAGWLKANSAEPKHEHRHKFWHTGTAYHLLPYALPDLAVDLLLTMQALGDPQAQQYQLTLFPESRQIEGGSA